MLAVIVMGKSLKLTVSVVLLLWRMKGNTCTVTLSPSGVAPVCSGDQLELTCTTTEDLLQWRFSLIRGNETTATGFSRTVHSTGGYLSHLEVNSIMFNFSRTTSYGSVPVISTLLIGPASNSLNGTVINCVTSEVSSTTIIIIRKRNSVQDNYVREQATEFEKEDITVILEWDELNSLHSVNVSVIPQTQVNISTSIARLTMAYNIMYNVSIMVSHPCEQNSVTVFTKMYYYPANYSNTSSTCISLEAQVDDSVTVLGCINSGATVTFHCPSGLVLDGTNSLTCIAKAHSDWDLEVNDLDSEVICSGNSSSDTDSGTFVTVNVAVISSRESRPTTADDQDTDEKQELDLKENVAYVPVVLI